MDVSAYTPDQQSLWDSFNKAAFNGCFMFDRAYMDYHADRFQDGSLLIHENGKLVALLAANKTPSQFHSHAGLTFGGLVLGRALSQRAVIRALSAVINFVKKQGFTDFHYKAMPAIYFPQVYYNIDFALSFLGFDMNRRDASTSIFLNQRGKLSKGRKAAINKANKTAVTIEESLDFDTFFEMQDANIQKKYDAKSVHTATEMKQLQSQFPQNIKLFLVTLDSALLAGAIIYRYAHVMHLQYFAMNDAGQQLSATDLLIDSLLSRCEHQGIVIFDFGISTENNGLYLNEGLNKYKESFGGVTTLYDSYALTLI